MLNYISAELYKVRRRKSTWALLALLLGLESLYILLFAHGECYELLNAFVTTLTLGLPMAMLLSALVCSDMGRSGTLKNELSAGLPRSRIYLGKLLSALIVALIALSLVVGLCLAAGGLLFRHSDPAQDRAALAVVGYCLAAALPLWGGGLGGGGGGGGPWPRCCSSWCPVPARRRACISFGSSFWTGWPPSSPGTPRGPWPRRPRPCSPCC